jgi:hypothetical protein
MASEVDNTPPACYAQRVDRPGPLAYCHFPPGQHPFLSFYNLMSHLFAKPLAGISGQRIVDAWDTQSQSERPVTLCTVGCLALQVRCLFDDSPDVEPGSEQEESPGFWQAVGIGWGWPSPNGLTGSSRLPGWSRATACVPAPIPA